MSPISTWQPYNVRKDNTVAYHGNFYSLPLGTYQGQETKIYMEVIQNQLNLYSTENQLLTIHKISVNKGELVRNTDHCRDKSATIGQTYDEVLKLLGNSQKAQQFLELLKIDKPRYYHDNLRAIKQGLPSVSTEIIDKTIEICLESKTYNGNVFCQIANKYFQDKKHENLKIPIPIKPDKINTQWQQLQTTPQTSSIDTYEKLF